MDDYPFLRELRPPLTSAQLAALDSRCRVVQFREPLGDAELRRVADFLRAYPRVRLRVYGHRSYETLDFLAHFGDVRRVVLEIFELQDIGGLRFLRADLESLGLGGTRKRFSLSLLARFEGLRSLWLEKHAKDFDVVGRLTALRSLSLRSISLPDLRVLRPLRELEELEIKLGGTTDLALLPEVGRLSYFEAWMVRGLADLGPLARVTTLEFVFLQALKHVTSLPSFRALTALRRVHVETMKGLKDLAPIAEAPRLEELVAIDMSHLGAEAFQPFVGHPALRAASIGLGSTRKNAAVSALLRLPNASSREPPDSQQPDVQR